MDNAWIEKYGHGSIAVMMGSNYDEFNDVKWKEVVANILFRYCDGNKILVWKEGVLYDLREAYEKDLLI